VIRIGHRGAAALAPPNSIAGVRAALAAGVDMIEFDVSPGLVVAHDPGRPGPALRDFIAEAATLAPPEVGFLVDLKAAGYEDEALEAGGAAGRASRSARCAGSPATRGRASPTAAGTPARSATSSAGRRRAATPRQARQTRRCGRRS
jgi:hypothetical protein